MTYFDISPGYKAVKHLPKPATHGIDYELCGSDFTGQV
jgi:hypothetical protein